MKTREIDLISYLPQFIAEYKEIIEIMAAEEPEIKTLAEEILIFNENQYILTCDEKGIRRFEELLKINIDTSISLEERRAKVLLIWNDYLPYTYITLIERLDEICGVGNYTIREDFKNYALVIKVSLEVKEVFGVVKEMLHRMLPANLMLNLDLKYITWGEILQLTWGQVKKSTWREIKEESLENLIKEGAD